MKKQYPHPTHHSSPDLDWVISLSDVEIAQRAKEGIRGSQLREIQEATQFSNQEWAVFLQVDRRTIERYRKQRTGIGSASSERVLIMAQLAAKGRDVFGTDALFLSWLGLPNFALGGMTPAELLDTTTGMYVVRAELGRIEYGVY